MGQFSLDELRAEIAKGPAGLGLPALAHVADDAGIAAALNAARKGVTVTEAVVPRDTFLLGILPALLALTEQDDATQRKWDRVLAVVRSVDAVHLAHPAVSGLLALAVQDKLLTPEQAAAIGARPGSRAEELWGAGTVITAEQAGGAR